MVENKNVKALGTKRFDVFSYTFFLFQSGFYISHKFLKFRFCITY